MEKFKIGDRVKVLDQSHGWGRVKKGDIGVVINIPDHNQFITVNFTNHKYWNGTLHCFKLFIDETIFDENAQYEIY